MKKLNLLVVALILFILVDINAQSSGPIFQVTSGSNHKSETSNI